MEEIAATTPSFAGVTYDLLEEKGSVQWPCNEAHPDGSPIMHVDGFVRGKGKVHRHRIRGDGREDRPALPAAADHRADPQPVQCRRADAAHGKHRLAQGGRAGDPSP
jgi:hypothetical protein